MRIKILSLLAAMLGVSFKIDGVPYGSAIKSQRADST
jgi:hypothetical protein